MVAAVAFSAIDACLLAIVSRETDPESLTAGWIVFGGPGLAFGPHIWLAAPLNGLALYVLILLGVAIYRSYKKYSKPAQWPDS